jgi:hypothetical protein
MPYLTYRLTREFRQMMNQLNKIACALAVLATTTLPALAATVDVRVIGTITPTACTPTVSGGGTVDYGSINPSTLEKDTFTVLPEKELDFAIACDAPAKVAVTLVSQRGASALNTDGTLSTLAVNNSLFGGADTSGTAGLGLDGTKGIGGYGIRLAQGTVTADGLAVDSIEANGNTTAWSKATTGSLINTDASVRYASWATAGTTVPVAFTNLAGKLGVQAYINKASELNLSQPVALDGMATIELRYL